MTIASTAKIAAAISALAIAAAAPAFAQTTHTTTVDRPNYLGTRIVTVDPTTGTYDKDATLTRKSDGATATRTVDGQRTDSGVSISGGSTGFNGKTTSFAYDRTRTATGSTATGTYTGRQGNSYNYNASLVRNGDGSGYQRSQSVTGADGSSLYNRNVVASRTATGTSRTVTTDRAAGFHARGFGGFRRR